MASSGIFQVERDGEIIIVELANDVGSFADDDLLGELNHVLERMNESSTRGVVIDFSGVSYFGSILLEALLVIWNQLHPAGGKLVLCNVSEVGTEILHISKFDTLWPLHASRPEAIEAARRGGSGM